MAKGGGGRWWLGLDCVGSQSCVSVRGPPPKWPQTRPSSFCSGLSSLPSAEASDEGQPGGWWFCVAKSSVLWRAPVTRSPREGPRCCNGWALTRKQLPSVQGWHCLVSTFHCSCSPGADAVSESHLGAEAWADSLLDARSLPASSQALPHSVLSRAQSSSQGCRPSSTSEPLPRNRATRARVPVRLSSAGGNGWLPEEAPRPAALSATAVMSATLYAKLKLFIPYLWSMIPSPFWGHKMLTVSTAFATPCLSDSLLLHPVLVQLLGHEHPLPGETVSRLLGVIPRDSVAVGLGLRTRF